MRKSLLAVASAAALGVFAGTSASAMPIAPSAPVVSSVDQVRYVCNEWGRCWWRPNYYRGYGFYGYGPRPYYRPRYYGGYGWPHRHYWRGYYGPRFYGGW